MRGRLDRIACVLRTVPPNPRMQPTAYRAAGCTVRRLGRVSRWSTLAVNRTLASRRQGFSGVPCLYGHLVRHGGRLMRRPLGSTSLSPLAVNTQEIAI
jgi:hypothetical protein